MLSFQMFNCDNGRHLAKWKLISVARHEFTRSYEKLEILQQDSNSRNSVSRVSFQPLQRAESAPKRAQRFTRTGPKSGQAFYSRAKFRWLIVWIVESEFAEIQEDGNRSKIRCVARPCRYFRGGRRGGSRAAPTL